MREVQNDRSRKLLIEIVAEALKGAPSAAAWQIADADEARELLRLASQQLLLPLVLDACRDCRTVRELPDFSQILVNACRAYAQQLVRDREIRTLLAEAYEAGHTPLVLKGLMCRLSYPNGALRSSTDEDLYIRPEDMNAFRTFLEERGFSRVDAGALDENARNKRPAECCYADPETKLCIELHPAFFSREEAFARAEAALSRAYDRRTWFDGDGRVCDTIAALFAGRRQSGAGTRSAAFSENLLLSLSPTDHLFFLLAHAYKHFLYSGFGIRQVLDIGLWTARYGTELDWDSLEKSLNRCRMSCFASAVLRLARDRFGIALTLPESLAQDETPLEPMLRDLLDAGIYGGAELSRLHSAPILLDRAAQGEASSPLHQLFPKASALEGRYPFLKKRPWLLPWAWLRRDLAYLGETLTHRDSSPFRTLQIAEERTELAKLYKALPDKRS